MNYYKQLDIVEEELITKNEQDQIKFPNQKWYRTVTEMFFCFIYEILYIVVFWEENGPDFCQKFLKEMERSLIWGSFLLWAVILTLQLIIVKVHKLK